MQNHVTISKAYRSFDWQFPGVIGYKFEFPKKKLYVLPLFGLAKVIDRPICKLSLQILDGPLINHRVILHLSFVSGEIMIKSLYL